jgi:hypothetical protein
MKWPWLLSFTLERRHWRLACHRWTSIQEMIYRYKICWKRKMLNKMIIYNWLIDYLWLYVPLKNFSFIYQCRWRTEKFWLMLGIQGLWAGRDLHCVTPALTQDLGFSSRIRKSTPFSHLLRHNCCRSLVVVLSLSERKVVSSIPARAASNISRLK